MNTTGFRMYCSAHQKVSDDTDKRTVKDYLWLSTFIIFVTSFLLDVQGLRKHSGKASLWVGVLLCFT